MFCELHSFFFLPSDINSEDKRNGWQTNPGRIHLGKEMTMKIESTSNDLSLEALELWKEKMQQQKQIEKSTGDTDQYISGISAAELPTATSTYNAMGMMSDILAGS